MTTKAAAPAEAPETNGAKPTARTFVLSPRARKYLEAILGNSQEFKLWASGFCESADVNLENGIALVIDGARLVEQKPAEAEGAQEA